MVWEEEEKRKGEGRDGERGVFVVWVFGLVSLILRHDSKDGMLSFHHISISTWVTHEGPSRHQAELAILTSQLLRLPNLDKTARTRPLIQ